MAVAEKTLITGAAGFAGSHLVELLSGQELHAWTRSSVPPALSAAARWDIVDLMDRTAVRRAIEHAQPSVVYHMAGSPQVAASWLNSAEPLAHNVIGTHHLLDALRLNGRACRVLIPGSATVYASSSEAIREDGRLAPVSPYALSKYAQERLGLRAIAEDGLAVVTTRSFNHTGARQTPQFVAPSMARQVALIEKGGREPVLKVGNLDAQRDFTDVRDMVRAYAALIERGTSGEVYNVASGRAHSMRQLLDALLARSSVDIAVELDPERMRPHDTPLLLGDASKLRAATDWAPAISFDQMVDDLLDFWRREVGRGQ